jgi:CheY-like chemotaxis protein
MATTTSAYLRLTNAAVTSTILPVSKVRRLLLADDEHVIHRAVLRVAELRGWVVMSVTSGANVLTKALETRPDMIVLDMRFPDADGRDILSSLKRDTRTSHIPVIVWSGSDLGNDREITLDLGAEDYVEKGAPEELISKIRRVFLRLEQAPT